MDQLKSKKTCQLVLDMLCVLRIINSFYVDISYLCLAVCVFIAISNFCFGDPRQKHVLIVEDLIDTGVTLKSLM